MPSYSYSCLLCDHAWDAVVAIDERDQQDCPHCGARPSEVERHFDAPSIMAVSCPDGTRRFDSVRTSRQLEKAIKAERDKTTRKKLEAERHKLVKGD